MITIRNDIEITEKTKTLAEVLIDPELLSELFKLGIRLERKAEDFDFIFAIANEIDEPEPKTIAFERIDGCQIRYKNLLKHKNVVKLVKMYRYADWEVNNLPCIDGRIFTRHLEKNSNAYKAVEPLPRELESKLALGVSFLHYKRNNFAVERAKTIDFAADRDIDVFFAGTTVYGKHGHASGALISKHRLSCIKAIQELGLKVETWPDRQYNYHEYLEKMANSKVVVSPWGWGESCYRDYEAMILGAEVIKPVSYQILSNPPIYSGLTPCWCMPSWSDLSMISHYLLHSWDGRRNQRESVSKYLQENRKPANTAKIIAAIVKEANDEVR
jgi:hypothetical protein